MKDDRYEEIVELIKKVNELMKAELIKIANVVNQIILYNCEDERTISFTFDRMLSLCFVSKEEVRDIYYQLLDYTYGFNPSLSEDYKQIYIDYFDDDKLHI